MTKQELEADRARRQSERAQAAQAIHLRDLGVSRVQKAASGRETVAEFQARGGVVEVLS